MQRNHHLIEAKGMYMFKVDVSFTLFLFKDRNRSIW